MYVYLFYLKLIEINNYFINKKIMQLRLLKLFYNYKRKCDNFILIKKIKRLLLL